MPQSGRTQPIPREARKIPVPAVALDRWLAEIDDPGELRVALRVLALSSSVPGRKSAPPSVSLDELLDDISLRRAADLGNDQSIRVALAAALMRGTLVAARVGGESRIWVYDERVEGYLSQAMLEVIEPSDIAGAALTSLTDIEESRLAVSRRSRANIFGLYEQHIGTFGHGMAEQLLAAEEEYPASWVDEAFAIAAEQNVRSWGYVHAILRRWLHDGKPIRSTATEGPQREQQNVDGKPGHDTAPDSRTGYLESYRRRYGRLPWESIDDRVRDGG